MGLIRVIKSWLDTTLIDTTYARKEIFDAMINHEKFHSPINGNRKSKGSTVQKAASKKGKSKTAAAAKKVVGKLLAGEGSMCLEVSVQLKRPKEKDLPR